MVGSGPAGILAALEVASQTNLRVLMLERIKRLHDSREVANGFMGGSSRSDVKLFLTGGFGGEITNSYVIEDVMEVLERWGKRRIRRSKNRLTQRQVEAIQGRGVEVDEPEVAQLGSEHMAAIEKAMHGWLLKNVDFRSNCGVQTIDVEDGRFRLETSAGTFGTRYCILAMGRGGTGWLAGQKLGVDLEATSYDLGVRLEFPQALLKELTDKSTNFRLRFGDFRTTAISCGGTVELENVYGIQTSNGRTISGRAGPNSNFGLLKKIASKNPLQEMSRVVQIVNVLADGQLFRESPSRLLSDSSQLSYLPEFVQMKEGLQKIFEVWPQLRSRASMYAPEARLNGARVKTSQHGQTSIPGLYVCGDMSGQTKSFMQACGSGLLAGRNIVCAETGF